MNRIASTGIALRVERKQTIAQAVAILDLADADGGLLPGAEPGAHVSLSLPNGLRRSYSLLNYGAVVERYTIAVALDERSRGGSRFIHESMDRGAVLETALPRNDFQLVETAARSVFLAGGIGVTPLYAMASRLAALGKPFAFHLAARSRDRAVFAAELADLGDLYLHIDDEAAGRLLDMRAAVECEPAGTHFYCCGPAPMIAAFLAAVADRPAELVHFERFSACGGKETDGSAFTVHLARSGRLLQVDAGRSILEVVREAGIAVESSCEDGVCGTCETRVIAGNIVHRDAILTDREQAAGDSMIICVSRCGGGTLVLDL